MFCGNMDKLKVFKDICIKYGTMDALMIPNYHDRITAHHSNKWYGTITRKLLLDHWSLFTLEHTKYFQHDIVEYCEADAVSSECVRDFTCRYST